MRKHISKPSSPSGGPSRRRRAPIAVLVTLITALPLLPANARMNAAESPRGDKPAIESASFAKASSAVRFHRLGARHTLRAKSGIRLTTSLGRWRSSEHDFRGAVVKAESPWGEELNVEFFLSDSALLAEINGRIRVLTTFDADRNPLELEVTVDGRTTTTYLGNRARLFAAGAPLPPVLEAGAQEALALALRDELSPAFLSGLRSIDRPAERVGCIVELIGCATAISLWVIDIAALPAACIIGGVPTFGVSCALAVVGHELASAAVALSCGQFATCRQTENTPPEEPDERTPIILDMDGRGFRLTGPRDGVDFDLTGNGKPDRVAWTVRDGGEAFLALDRNRNGRIDDGRELFGSRTPLVDGSLAEHGFWALMEYDLRATGGNENGTIDAGDAMFDRLVLWTDHNHDGVSDRKEIRSLRQAGVLSMSLDYRVDGRRDRHGNRFVLNSKALVESRGRQQTRMMSDVYLQIEQ